MENDVRPDRRNQQEEALITYQPQNISHSPLNYLSRFNFSVRVCSMCVINTRMFHVNEYEKWTVTAPLGFDSQLCLFNQ